MAGLRLHLPMLHPEHYCSQRRVRGQSDWLSFLCKSLSYSISSRFIPAPSPTPFTVHTAVRLIKARDLAELIEFDPDLRHVARNKQTRKSPIESGISALP
jgi:hypothetical protein